MCFSLAGCIQAQVDLDIQGDGSGEITLQLSLEKSQRDNLSQMGKDPFERLAQQLSGPAGEPLPGITIDQRHFDNRDWLIVQVSFLSPEDLNARMAQTGLFDSFALVRQSGWVDDRLVLNARMRTLDVRQLAEDAGLPWKEPEAIEVIVHLPGFRREANGLPIGDTTSSYLWKINPVDPPWIHATSQVWNAWNIVLSGLGVLLVLFVGLLISTLAGSRTQISQRAAKDSGHSTVGTDLGSSDTESLVTNQLDTYNLGEVGHIYSRTQVDKHGKSEDLLASLNVNEILTEFNQHVLRGQGVISQAPGELSITWQSATEGKETPIIRVHSLGDWLVTVNGQSVKMTPDGIKQGIVGVYRQLRDHERA